MHNHLQLLLFFLLLHVKTSFFVAGLGGSSCNRHCGGAAPVPYPFGFSGDCPILLVCNETTSTALLPHSTTAAAAYPILSFNATASTFLATVAPSCNRTVREAEASLTGAGYGVSSLTGLFLRGGGSCHVPRGAGFNCTVAADIMTTVLRTAQCHEAGAAGGNNTSWICVSALSDEPAPMPNGAAAPSASAPAEQFMRWEMVRASRCQDALTATVYGVDAVQGLPSLQFGVAELGWWLNGTCDAAGRASCASNATCHNVETPTGALGHRCMCQDGMNGDGYAAGDGCRRDAAGTNKKNVPLIVAGVLTGVAACTAVLLLCRLHRRRSAAGRYGSAMRLLSEAATSSGVPVYSYHEVARATNGFSHTHRLGTGAYGTVYVGKLPASSALVAIKRLRYRLHHDDDDGDAAALLLNEIRLISSVSHPNLVRLLGCCLDRGEQILVYEYVPNGTLAQHLHGGGLSWRARLGVAAETASAIAYLHGTRPPIFHRDVKSSNILLDADLRPKLADFGLSRAVAAAGSHVSTAPQGTPGYVDPEYHQNFHLSDKSDVYSFGVVLLELITAMKVVDFDRPPSEVNLASLALDRIGKGRVGEIVDPALVHHDGRGEEWVMESVRHVSELAFRCLAFQKDVRPCMSEVATELGRIRVAAPAPGSESGSKLELTTTGLQIDMSFDSSSDSVVKKKAASPVSVHEVWVSDRSSPSTNGSNIMPRFQ